jgi:hypothetical protein
MLSVLDARVYSARRNGRRSPAPPPKDEAARGDPRAPVRKRTRDVRGSVRVEVDGSRMGRDVLDVPSRAR